MFIKGAQIEALKANLMQSAIEKSCVPRQKKYGSGGVNPWVRAKNIISEFPKIVH